MIIVLIMFIFGALAMQGMSIRKNIHVHKKISGVIRSRADLLLVKEAINLNMRFAILYIGAFIVFLVLLVILVINGSSVMSAFLALFIAGVTTLPCGLIGKRFEDRLKKLDTAPEVPELKEKYQQYIRQWNEPRFQLPD
jgi:hypothetical protein